MDYLQLVNDFLIETGMEDEVATVDAAIDDVKKATVWVRDGWLEIQRQHSTWDFRWAEGSFNTVAAQQTYTLADANLVQGDDLFLESLRIDSEESNLELTPIDDFRYKTDTGAPSKYDRRPNGSMVLYRIPDATYTIQYEYAVAPVVLVADSDTPAMDPAWHKAIVWLAITNYAREQGKEWQGLYLTASREYTRIHTEMTNAMLPTWGKRIGLDG